MVSWQHVDPPPPEGRPRYAREAVTGAERRAWAGEHRGRRAAFFYDGIEFWRQLGSGERRAVSPLDVPARGWWHRPECNCALCQDHVPAGQAKRTAAGRP